MWSIKGINTTAYVQKLTLPREWKLGEYVTEFSLIYPGSDSRLRFREWKTGFGNLTANKQINNSDLRGPLGIKYTEAKMSASVLLANKCDSVELGVNLSRESIWYIHL